ncbi:MAG: polyprenyl synthetase family protein, partial [Clostridia bacterium]|nr:polyprenyl synthetase family protein [Clostridia bacterium]
VLGCCSADDGKKYFEIARKYGKNIGLAFQVVDDILDVTSDEETLGKPIGSDSQNNKTTYLDFMTLEEADSYARELTDEACEGLGDSEFALVLKDLAYYLLERKN